MHHIATQVFCLVALIVLVSIAYHGFHHWRHETGDTTSVNESRLWEWDAEGDLPWPSNDASP